ncbi:MAG: rod shape-determining protein RodA [Flavobacteriaceae bacterium]|nr:rod shape-determining protein RodA [Flavobacteriaceae bacterium]MBJ33978.1 rod shape-determining protein RodA [Flavobacteriaceae bacterium]|tara:strand:+ start:1219 stop:2460 length:1242 start_codon:yes stop_codon:yes gene_type:complete
MNKFLRFDWYALILYLMLVGIGLINIYSAVYDFDNRAIADGFMQKQIIAFGIGLIVIFLFQFIDIKFFERYASILYLLSMLSLLGLWLFGTDVSGARSWYTIGGFSLQPSEFAKVAVALAIAKHLGSFNTLIDRVKDYLGAFVIIAIPAILTILQPDPGTAMVLLGFFFVLHAEGLSTYFLNALVLLFGLFILTLLIGANFTLITIGVLSLFVFIYMRLRKLKKALWPLILISFLCAAFTLSVSYIFDNVFEQRHRDRFNILLGKEVDIRGVGYNINQSQIAIGSGGGLGKGFLQGTQTKGGFVPEQQTDYIFTTVGEEWGFLGTALVLGLFMMLMTQIIKTAYKQKNTFSRVFCLGFACVLLIHVGINLGMVVGLVPTIGIPLPLMSYGGSSLLAFSMFMGIYLRLYFQRIQ